MVFQKRLPHLLVTPVTLCWGKECCCTATPTNQSSANMHVLNTLGWSFEMIHVCKNPRGGGGGGGFHFLVHGLIVTSTATVMHSDLVSANFQFLFPLFWKQYEKNNVIFFLFVIQTTITVQKDAFLSVQQKRINTIQDNSDHSCLSEGQLA